MLRTDIPAALDLSPVANGREGHDAEHGWRSIAGDAGRRGTFGLVKFLLFFFPKESALNVFFSSSSTKLVLCLNEDHYIL